MRQKFPAVLLLAALWCPSAVHCITGGHTTLPTSAPFAASIQSPTHVCGGALIKATWVLTTASCVTGRTDLKVLLGSHRLLTTIVRHAVLQTVAHPSYDAVTGANNVALLRIDAVTQTPRIAVIPLNDAAVPADTVTAFYGWGALSYGSTALSNALHTLYQRVVTLADCRQQWANIETLADGQVCARIQERQAACGKDEGGPLVGYTSGKLIGLFSHGAQCSGRLPDVFVDVLTYKPWIEQTAV